MFVKGDPNIVQLIINGKAQDGSKIMIPLSRSIEIKENKFIQFSNILEGVDPLNKPIEKSNFEMSFNLSIDNQSQIQLIIDEEVGDVIKGYGNGDLNLIINKE